MDSKAYITLSQVVNSYLNEVGDYTKDNFLRYLNIVIEGMSEINMDTVMYTKNYYPVVTSTNTVSLPPDFVDYLVIGYINRGIIRTLTRNDDINIPSGEVCGIEIVDDNALSKAEIPVVHGYASGGAWNIGEYTIDYNKRRIVFKGDLMGQQLVIRYVSTGINMSEQTYIKRDMMHVLKDYLQYILAKRSVSLPEARVLRLERQYYNKLAEYKRSQWQLTKDELLDIFYSGYSQAV